jgi:CSLREA domain-containing protein
VVGGGCRDRIAVLVCGAAGRGGGDVGRPGGGFDGGASTAGETYLVTTTADTNDGRCDAQCSVREAILAANAHPGADTVRIPAGVYTLTIQGVNESAGATGDLDITGPVDVVGAGQGHTILDGARIDRVLSVLGDGPTRVSGLTVRHGLAPVRGGGGGGIHMGGLALALSHVTVTGNATAAGNTGDSAGGGIETGGLAGEVNLTLTDVRITGNRAHYGGAYLLAPAGRGCRTSRSAATPPTGTAVRCTAKFR